MKFTLSEQARMKQIQAKLAASDSDQISREVERLERLNSNPIAAILFTFAPDEHTKEAADYLTMTDPDAQEELSIMFSRLLEMRLQAEQAIGVYLSTLEHREVA